MVLSGHQRQRKVNMVDDPTSHVIILEKKGAACVCVICINALKKPL